MDAITVGFIGVALSVIGGAMRISHVIGHSMGQVNTRLDGHDKDLDHGRSRHDQTDDKINVLSDRVTRLETRIEE